MAISQVGSVNSYNSGTGATTGGMTVTCPSGITTNDVLFVGMSNAVTITPPSGFTQLVWQSSNVNSGVWYRICDGTETGGTTTYNFSTSGSTKWAGWILALRGVDTSQIVDNSGAAIATNNQTTASTTATFNSTTTVTDGCYVMLCAFARNSANNVTGNSFTTVSGYSELADVWSTQGSTGVVGNNGAGLDTATQSTHGTVSSTTSTAAKSSLFFNVTVAVKPIPPAVNVTIDPNTYTDSTATSESAAGWSSYILGGQTASRTSAQAHSGSFSTQVSGFSGGLDTAAQTASGIFFPVSPGQVVRAGGWVYTTGASQTAASNIDFYQSDQTTQVSTLAGSTTNLTQNAWTYVSQTSVAPTGAAYGVLWISSSTYSSSNSWYFDDPFVWIANGSVTAAPAGTVSATSSTPATISGVVSAASTAAPAGTVSGTANVTGAVAATTTAAPAGSVTAIKNVTISGALAATTTAAAAGAVAQTVPGALSQTTTAVPSGTVSGTATVAGQVSATTTTAPAGSVSAAKNVTLTGAVAAAATAAPAGSVTTAGNVTITGAIAATTTAAPAGGTAQTIPGTLSQTSVTTPAGTVAGTATVVGAVSAITTAAPAGSVTASRNVTISGGVGAVTTAAPNGSLSTTVTIAGTLSQVTTGAPAGSVDTAGNVSVSGMPTGQTTAAPAGAISTDATIIGDVAASVTSSASGVVFAGFSTTVNGVTAGITLAAANGRIAILFTVQGRTLRAQTVGHAKNAGTIGHASTGTKGVAVYLSTRGLGHSPGSRGGTADNGQTVGKSHVTGTQGVPVAGG